MKRNNSLKEAKCKLKEVSIKLKQFKKELGIPNRSRDVVILKRIIAKHNDFKTKHIKIGNRYILPEQRTVFNLIKVKAFLKGYITAKMEENKK